MARTKGITLRIRKQAAPSEDTLADGLADAAASSSEQHQPPHNNEYTQNQEQLQDQEMAHAEGSRASTLSRSRSSRLARTRSQEDAFEGASPSVRTTPSRRSRRQSTKPEPQSVDENVGMASPQQETFEPDAEGDENEAHGAFVTPRSRSTRSRVKSSTTPVPQTPSAPRPKRSPKKASRISVVGRRGGHSAKDALAEDEEIDATEEQDDPAEQEDGAGGNDANADERAEEHGEGEEEDDQDADADGDGDGDNDDEEGVDEEGRKTVTIKGTKYLLEADEEEVVLPSDPDGDKKVDDKGRLLGGRQYKAYNFTSDLREDPEKVYMLSIDAARSAGYRDSLYFFRRNPQIFKIELMQEEKDKLIDDGRLSGQLKTRNVTMVPARNVYKLHGARFLSGGKAIIDDYYEAEARASGVKEGKTVGGMSNEEQERRREAERERERPKKKADTFSYTTIDPQGDPVITQFGDAGQQPWVRAGNWQSRKAALQRMDITEDNWMLEMARSVRGMNTELNETRKDRLSAFPRFNRYIGIDGVAEIEEAKDEVADCEAEPEDDPEALNDLPPWEREKLPAAIEGELEEESKKRKAQLQDSLDSQRRRGPPIGVYEPNTHLPHFSVLTQPSQASMIKLAQRPAFISDPGQERGDRRPILGGDKLGSGAWGIASFSVECLPPAKVPGHVVVPAGASADSVSISTE